MVYISGHDWVDSNQRISITESSSVPLTWLHLNILPFIQKKLILTHNNAFILKNTGCFKFIAESDESRLSVIVCEIFRLNF